MTERRQRVWWTLVAVVSALLAHALITVWRASECCELGDLQPLTNAAQVEAELQASDADDLFRLPTGIYLQSLSFQTAYDVQVTGRLWQRTPPGRNVPDSAKLGVLFPDAISDHSSNLTELYRDFLLPDGSRLDTWEFQVLLRQDFDYSAYPLDGKRVWIRFWTDDVDDKIQLVPDLNAYANDSPTAHPGIAESLVPGEWAVQQAFFGFSRNEYSTDFGRNTQTFPLALSRPELRFYVILKRNFIDAFLVNLVPLFVTLGLLFGLMLTVTRDPDIAERLGFSTLAVFGSASGLFFISLLGHIQVRQQFAGSQIVYIEYFYIMSYLVLLSVSVFSFSITHADHANESVLMRNDGRLLKMLYWPAVLGAALTISITHLPIEADDVWRALF